MRKTIIYFGLTFLLVLSGNTQNIKVIQERMVYKQVMECTDSFLEELGLMPNPNQ